MAPPTPAEILERTQWDLFWLPSDAAAVDRPGLAYSHSRSDRTFLNCVVRTRLEPAEVPAAIEEVGRAHATVTSRWMVLDGTRPDGLERALGDAGYERMGEHHGAVLPVAAWRDVDTGHTVRRVEDATTLEALHEVASLAFGDRRPAPGGVAEELARCADPAGRVHRYVGFDAAGAPVSSGGLTAFPDLRFGLLWAGGTVPSARGQGAYRALLQARVHEARRLGLGAVGLYARIATSGPIVTRLGFETHGTMVYRERKPLLSANAR